MPQLPASLVQMAIAGDQAALVGLLQAARPDIRRYARAACRANDVDDAVQEALWLLYRKVGTLRAASSLSAWLFAIVRRECLRLARTFRLVPAEAQHAEASVLSQTEAALRLDVAAAIQSLPEHYRAIVVMRDIEERTVDELADALGLTREAVKGRLHRARTLLREYLLR
jgi:RNA polymerase sigma factor (sigma-70 family)